MTRFTSRRNRNGLKPFWEREGEKFRSENKRGADNAEHFGQSSMHGGKEMERRGMRGADDMGSRSMRGEKNNGFDYGFENYRGDVEREQKFYDGQRDGQYGDYDTDSAENEKNRYHTERLEFHAKRALSEENLPTSFAKLLCGEDEEETLDNIAGFKEEFLKAIEAAVSRKLRGNTPRTASGYPEYDPFLNGFGN